MGLIRELLQHPDELQPLLRVRATSKRITKLPRDPDLAFCYDMLNKVSRSFAIVIQQLDKELRDAVCVFYLVLRALDTIEDDMAVAIDVKVPLLKDFHNKITDTTWTFICGTKHYHVLMQKLPTLSRAFLALNEGYRTVIADITRRMGEGMAEFIQREVETVKDYDLYCHYVAGLVGYGLTDLFSSSKLEKHFSEDLSNSMGLFLQKVNIIRDYLEDINELPAPRMFWPREIWGLYAEKLDNFKDTGNNGAAAVKCLNHLLTDALQHARNSLLYLSQLQEPSIFRFCAIPQIMAMGTIDVCFNNINVFKGVVKMRKGLSAKIMDQTKNMGDVYVAFHSFASSIEAKIDPSDPSAAVTRERIADIKARCEANGVTARADLAITRQSDITTRFMLWLVFAIYTAYILDFSLPRWELISSPFSHDLDWFERLQKIVATVLLLISTTLLILPSGQKKEED